MSQVKSTVSEKNTKSQIMTAYKEALNQIKELKKKSPDRKAEIKQSKEQETVSKATTTSVESMLANLRQTRKVANDTILQMEGDISQKKEIIDELVEAKNVLEGEIEELTEIKAECDTLVALQKAHQAEIEKFEEQQRTTKERFEAELKASKEQWEKEQEVHDLLVSERDTEFEKQWRRKIEDRKYDFAQLVKKETDEFEQRKITQERELADAKAFVEKELKAALDAATARADEYNELKAKVEAFPAEKEEAVTTAVESAVKREKARYGYEVNALKKDHEISVAVVNQKNEDLKERNASLLAQHEEDQKLIKELISKNEAIANSAIQGASRTVVLQSEHSKAN